MLARYKTRFYLALLLSAVLPGTVLAETMFELYPQSGAGQDLESLPSLAPRPTLFNGANRNQGLLAVKWQHRVNEENIFTLSAGYGDDIYLEETAYDTVSTMASLSWTRKWADRMHVTGSLFVGDEDARDEVFRHLERKYFGFTVGGRLTLFEKHSPFLSFEMLHSDYDEAAAADPLAPSTEYSRLTAGWDWQLRPNWRLRAGADYTLDDFSLNLYRYDKSRIFFSTRFDFR